MELARALTRMPRPFDPERGAEARAQVDGVDPDVARLVDGAAGCSPYLAGLIGKEAAWLREAVTDVETALAGQIETAQQMPADGDVAPLLRRSKRRMALLLALADLGGAVSLEFVTDRLTRFADATCRAALRAALAPLIARGKLPGQEDEPLDEAGGLAVFAMGKMGAGELNYSSDIDLICLFDETRYDPQDYAAARSTLARAVRRMCALLSDITHEGYVFRTDLRLRPDPSVTPVAMAMEAAERYYESLGRTWERAAYIKARPCAGDLDAGQRFLETLRPFVWRRHLDFAAIQDAHDMRLAIRAHKGTGGPITLSGHDMKLGRGGIREIEFFTQTRQLIAGGRDPDLRVRGTVEGLARLARKGWVPGEVAERLTDHYRFHRTVEHRMQMIRDAQTHDLPRSPEGFERLAAMMDRDRTGLEQELRDRLEEVHAETEDFFAPGAASRAETAAGFSLDDGTLARWHGFPAFRSTRAVALFDRIRPVLENRLSAAARPSEAVTALEGFLAGLPAGVQLFSLFEANPSLVDLLVDIVTTSPALAQYLSQNSGVFDAVIGGDFFAPWPGRADLTRDLAERLDVEADYETKLDRARLWMKEWHFRVGVHHLRALTTAEEAGEQYGDLARATLQALWPHVCAQFAIRHGPPPGRGAALLGMGSRGSGRLTPTSDLDMIVIYDPLDADSSEGRRPLATRQYYARLTQALITALSARTAQGRLYEVDMRLRPSGNQGPVATSWASFQSYQTNEAWVWEHLALARAEVCAGPDDLATDIAEFRRTLLGQSRDRNKIFSETAAMRARIAAAKTPVSLWEAKIGPGRMQDIELLAQACTVLTGGETTNIMKGLALAGERSMIDGQAAARLAQTHALCWRIQMAGRLLTAEIPVPEEMGAGARAVLLRAVGCEDLAGAEACLAETYDEAARVIDAALDITGQDESR